MAIRIVLAEDNYLVREGVRGLLETQDDLEVVATCDSLDSLLGAAEAERPDVVLTDIRMPPGGGDEGIQAAARLRETRPEIGVVVLRVLVPRLCARPPGAGRGPACLPTEGARQ